MTSIDIINLGRAIAASCHVSPIIAESNTADNAAMCEVVDQIHIEDARHIRVEDSKPFMVDAQPLELVRGFVGINIGEFVAITSERMAIRPASGATNLRRRSRIRIRELPLLRSSWTRRTPIRRPVLVHAR